MRGQLTGPNGERRPVDPMACAAKVVRLATGQEQEAKPAKREREQELIPA